MDRSQPKQIQTAKLGNIILQNMEEQFLTNMKIRRLRRLHKKEKDPKAKKRLQACILRKEKLSFYKIAHYMNEAYTTVHRWIKRINEKGLAGLYDIKNKGAPCRLDDKQLKQLVIDMEKGPEALGYGINVWTMRLVAIHIKKTFNVDYVVHSVWLLVRRLGFRSIKPRPKMPKSATAKEIKAFKKRARRMVRYWAKKGYIILVEDEAHIILGSMPKRGWFRTAKPIIQIGSVKGSKKRASMIGAIGEDGKYIIEVYDTANWDNFEKFLYKLYRKFGKVLLFLDNASYHSKEKLAQFTRETGGDVRFEFFLPYTPELNPIEKQWDMVKGALSGTIMKDAREVAQRIRYAIRKKSISIAKMHDCYTV